MEINKTNAIKGLVAIATKRLNKRGNISVIYKMLKTNIYIRIIIQTMNFNITRISLLKFKIVN